MDKRGKTMLIIIAIICVVLSGAIYLIRRDSEQKWLDSITYDTPMVEAFENTSEKISEEIKVYITGEVVSPGVYELSQGSRVADVIEMAGGLTENAGLDNINLAEYVKDAEKIVIPNNLKEADEPTESIQNENKLVNINTATAEELKTLPGVGDVTARNIITYRERNGDFTKIEDIKNVPRIGDRTFLQLSGLITV